MRCAVSTIFRPVALVACFAVITSIAYVTAATAATAATSTHAYGVIVKAYQHRDGTVRVTGYAFDRAHRDKTTEVCLTVGHTCVRVVRANKPSPAFNAAHRLRGGHRFAVTLDSVRPGAVLVLATHPGRAVTLDRASISTPGERVVAVARKYVGRARYIEGGAAPKPGFDCSGYTLYSYRTAGVAVLPHSAQAQRYVAHMHRISEARARPGDLVFYLGGGVAYHVAIYAGHGMQYAAATAQDGIRYQAIWSNAVEFRTDWH